MVKTILKPIETTLLVKSPQAISKKLLSLAIRKGLRHPSDMLFVGESGKKPVEVLIGGGLPSQVSKATLYSFDGVYCCLQYPEGDRVATLIVDKVVKVDHDIVYLTLEQKKGMLINSLDAYPPEVWSLLRALPNDGSLFKDRVVAGVVDVLNRSYLKSGNKERLSGYTNEELYSNRLEAEVLVDFFVDFIKIDDDLVFNVYRGPGAEE